MNDVLSAKDLMKVGMRGYKEFVDVNWHGKIIQVKTLLCRDEFLSLLQSVTQMCESQDGVYLAEFLDFALRVNIIMYYTNVELPENIDDVYCLVYYSNLYDVVCEDANHAQVKSVLNYFS